MNTIGGISKTVVLTILLKDLQKMIMVGGT